ncbi:MAG: energy transducer TonB [Pyrinomonadaceae bacterium]
MKETVLFIAGLLLVGILFGVSASGQVHGGAISAIDEPSEGSGGRTEQDVSRADRPTSKRSAKTTRPRASKSSQKPVSRPPKWDGFVVGDKYTFMNFEVVSAEKPYHTRAAKAGGASGLVQVEILIDTDGRVLTARARTGNKLLHPEAERAALASRFNRFTFGGKPARAIGFLVYRFGPAESE